MHAVLNTPVDRIRCSLVGELRVPARVSSLSVQPSPLSGRVGVHITTFEACSSFTRVTACRVAHPPYVGFIARLRPGRFPGSDARKLPSSTNNLLGWVLPPLVICAVEAHPITKSILSVVPARVSLDAERIKASWRGLPIELSGVNYFFGLTTTISPDQRRLLFDA